MFTFASKRSQWGVCQYLNKLAIIITFAVPRPHPAHTEEQGGTICPCGHNWGWCLLPVCQPSGGLLDNHAGQSGGVRTAGLYLEHYGEQTGIE